MTNEHDITKMMLEAIRAKSSNHKNLIRENEGGDFGGNAQAPTGGGSVESNIDNNIDAEEPDKDEFENKFEEAKESEDTGLDTPEGKEEAEKIADMVDNLVVVTSFKIYPENGNVVMIGKLQISDIEWQFSKNDGIFLNASNVELTPQIQKIVSTLSAYYENWQEDWAGKINEYTTKSDKE